jgi:hypothetical protein
MPGFKRLETAGITITVMAEKSRKTAIQDLQLTGKTVSALGSRAAVLAAYPANIPPNH